MKKGFLVTGANFMNKGAQAMLFVTVTELRKRFPKCSITMTTWERLGKIPYDFHYVSDTMLFGTVMNKEYSRSRRIRILVNALRDKNFELVKAFLFGARFRGIDAIIDISGFILSSQWGYQASKNYLNRIAVAKDNGIPFFIMPQSISPFNYEQHQSEMDDLILSYLPYPRIIYAREQSGYEVLTREYGLKNVEKSVDLVLQNKDIDESLLYRKKTEKQYNTITTRNNVAIIPNNRLLEHCSNTEELIALYQEIISRLCDKGKTVYLIMHSSEDREICKMIAEAHKEKNNVIFYDKDMDCMEFNRIIQSFDYVISSRYHAIVHAFKNSVPAIVLGWAEKYEELLEQFGQEKYMFDVRDHIDREGIIESINNMDDQWNIEKNNIGECLERYQMKNCFDILSEFFAS